MLNSVLLNCFELSLHRDTECRYWLYCAANVIFELSSKSFICH